MRQIFSNTLSPDEVQQVESIYYKQEKNGVSLEQSRYLISLSEKGGVQDMEGKAFMIYNIGKGRLGFQLIKEIREEQIKPCAPTIEEIQGDKLKSKIYTEFMQPTLRNGDTGYFVKKSFDNFVMWGDVFLLIDKEQGVWLCRVNQSEEKGKIKVSYDGSDVTQDVSVAIFESVWQLKKIDRWVSQGA